MSIELNVKDIEFLEKVKTKIVKHHKKCGGSGYYFKEDKTHKCECMQIISYMIDLRKSNIPIDYWNLTLDLLETKKKYKKEVKKYIEKIDNAIERGVGLFLTSPTRGVGKTSLACEIGKAAIMKRYYVYYNLMQNVVSDKFTNDQEIIEKIKFSELIIIDEIDKVIMRKESPLVLQIENFLRELLPAGKTIILCSNASFDEIENQLKIGSLIQRYMKIIEIEGNDFSKKRNKNLDELLDKKFDYLSEVMVNNAKIHHDNQEIAQKKEYYENYKSL